VTSLAADSLNTNEMKIKGLDHVALTVQNLQTSIDWYRQVLQLEIVDFPAWKDRPVMLRGGNGMLALFEYSDDRPKDTSIFHVAFSIDQNNYQAFIRHFQAKEIPYYEEDHHYFLSIYLIDPDGYKIELTTPTGIKT
jgi:catechol-2,3-dioxygenase